MPEKVLLVDFENVQQVDFSKIDIAFNVSIFVGANQKNIPFELVDAAQPLGTKVEWVKIEGNGSNALDFHIAMQLGRILESSCKSECIVLSKDKGFDPLIKFLNKAGLVCKRINSLLELSNTPISDANYSRVLDVLRKTPSRSLPRRRKTLTQHISAMFQKKLPQSDVDKIMDILFADKKVSETNNIISYTL
jgi:hypothetical protein